nr:AMP-binding protein [Actinoplanes siamensis]
MPADRDLDVAVGEVGELHTRGPYTIRGYFRADDHNARAFTADGWYRTGVLVRSGGGGNLIVTGAGVRGCPLRGRLGRTPDAGVATTIRGRHFLLPRPARRIASMKRDGIHPP